MQLLKIIRTFLFLFGACPVLLSAQGILQHAPDTYTNPVLPGFHPDPSITRVGDDYYMATSSFEFWPAIPIYHSKDLVNWRLVNHVASRTEQVDMSDARPSEGFYAPTLRYHEGTFYVAVTYVTRNPRRNRNMVFTTDDILSEWSVPAIITDDDGKEWGIDPDLFFDDDGKVYFTANAQSTIHPDKRWSKEIRIQEIDLSAMQLLGDRHTISHGAMIEAVALEAPHIFKKDANYYLLAAEGGTGMGHAVTVFRSDQVFGPYEVYSFNPLLTHRHLRNSITIQNIGHADLVQTQSGEWWMVALGVRHVPDIGEPLGRETFLVPMEWKENQYPVVNPGIGKVLAEDKRPDLPIHTFPPVPAVDDFEAQTLPLHWNTIRNTRTPYQTGEGRLILPLLPVTLKDGETPAFVGRRVQHHNFDVITKMHFAPQHEQEEAGLSLMVNDSSFYHFTLSKNKEQYVLSVYSGRKNNPFQLTQPLSLFEKEQVLYLRISSKSHRYTFSYSFNGVDFVELARDVSGRILSASGMIFTGTYVGVYASSNGQDANSRAEFEWFLYKPSK